MKTVVFRPTNSCNLRCTYCYDKNNHCLSTNEIRTNATDLFKKEEPHILKSLEMIYEGEQSPRIIFHGGEPLLIRTEVLDVFCRRLKEQGDISFSIQTNGILINDEVADLFKTHNFSVGISLDGCNETQNHARIFPDGSNSYETVMKKIKYLQENAIKFGIIMSITKAHKESAKELYDFIAKHRLSCNIRPVFASDPTNMSDIMSEDEYAKFFCELFDIWYDDEQKRVNTHQILELYYALKKELEPSFIDRSCNNSNRCFKDFISMDVFSNVYACNRLYGVDRFYYGNLKTDTMESVYAKVALLLQERNQAIAGSCASCQTLEDCNGGCPAESYDLYGDIAHPTPHCKVKRIVSEHVREKLQ